MTQQGYGPGYWIRIEQHLKGMKPWDLKNSCNPQNTYSTNTCNAYYHGQKGMAQASDSIGSRFHHAT